MKNTQPNRPRFTERWGVRRHWWLCVIPLAMFTHCDCGGSLTPISQIVIAPKAAGSTETAYGAIAGYGECGEGGALFETYCVTSPTGTAFLQFDTAARTFAVRTTDEPGMCENDTPVNDVSDVIERGDYREISPGHVLFVAYETDALGDYVLDNGQRKQEFGRVEFDFTARYAGLTLCRPANSDGEDLGLLPLFYGSRF